MAAGDIEHSELPDELLHEPKGASTAAQGTTYIADGAGSGVFKKIPVDSLDITIPALSNNDTGDITNIISVQGNTLSQIATGALKDVATYADIPAELTNSINQNTVEIYRLYLNLVQVTTSAKNKITKIDEKLSAVINALKEIGIVNDESSN